MPFRVAILTVSDTAAADPSLDKSGPILQELLEAEKESFWIVERKICADNEQEIAGIVQAWASSQGVDWVITSGGTGFGTRDRTPEAIAPLIQREAPGIVHLLLKSSIEHTPLAALSRPVAGTIGNTLVVTFPGSPKAVRENISALIQSSVVHHALDLIQGGTGRDVHAQLGVAAREAPPLGSSHREDHRHHHHHHHNSHVRSHAEPEYKSHNPALGASARNRVSPYPMVQLNDALQIVQQHVSALEIITVAVSPALRNCILAEDIFASQQLPTTSTTNVDGYAIDSTLTPGTYPVLNPRTHSLSSQNAVPKQHVYRINTGSPLPLGTDAVVMVEDTKLVRTLPSSAEDGMEESEEAEVELLIGVRQGENTRQPGSDVQKGELVLEKGTLLGPLGGEVGTLAFIGQASVKIIRKPVVALMSTGNEIVDIAGIQGSFETGRDGWTGTFDTNRPSLQAALEGMGYEVIDFGIVGDEVEGHANTMRIALERADILITTGGSSMGSSDLLKPVIERHLNGTVHFGRVAVKPGKPTTFATIPVSPVQKKPIFALPGNPASALVMFYVFVIPALRKMGGWESNACSLPRVKVEITDEMPLDPRPEFHRVHIRSGETGLRAFSTGGQRSSRMASLAGANGLVALPKGASGEKVLEGTQVDAILIGEIQPSL